MSTSADVQFPLTSSIRHGQSWADQEHSPGWAARSPPKFSEEIPEIELNAEEFDNLPASASNKGPISVFVGGLDYALEARDLQDFFASRGCKVSRVRILKSNGKSSGKAVMEVPDLDALVAVTRLSGSTLSGRQLIIKEDSAPKSSRKSERPSWRESDNQRPRKETGWQSASKGSKHLENRKKIEKETASSRSTEPEEEPKERKKLELKPRSKPLAEVPEVHESARSSWIFGQAKPRDERVFTKDVDAIPAPKEKSERQSSKKKKDKSEMGPARIQEPVLVPKVDVALVKPKKSANRFAVDLSSSSESE
jgi:RNA recognition motif-containing protein